MLAELDADPADLVVVDCLLLPVLRACADAGQTYVSLEHLFDAYLRRNWLHGPVGIAGRLRRLDPVGCWDSAALSLAATLPSLDPAGDGPLPANLRFTGPTIDPPAPHDLDSHEPAVLVSLSTCLFPGMPAALQRILDATADLEARVVVTDRSRHRPSLAEDGRQPRGPSLRPPRRADAPGLVGGRATVATPRRCAPWRTTSHWW